MSNPITLGPIKIHLPDENQSYFSLFEDFAELFDKEFQSEAYKLLKEKLKDVKPKPQMDYEADFISIETTNVDTLLATIEAVVFLSCTDFKLQFPVIDYEALRIEFTEVKKNRPKPKVWDTGDVFTIPLRDNSYSIGQVLDKRRCTCALFEFKSHNKPSLETINFKQLKPISICHLSNGDLLNNGTWEVIFNATVSLNPNSGHGGKPGEIGSRSYGGCGILTDLAEVYWGLYPWNTKYHENFYDEMLLKKVNRPASALVLNPIERQKFRKEKFGIDEPITILENSSQEKKWWKFW